MDAQWLKIQFDLNPHKSRAALIQKLSIETTVLDDILSGARAITADEYKTMRCFFDLPADGANAVQYNRRQASAPLTYRDLNPASLSDGAASARAIDWDIPKHDALEQNSDFISPNLVAKGGANFAAGINAADLPKTIQIFYVGETTMQPDFLHGEHVLIDTSDTHPDPAGVFVLYDGCTFLLRHCAALTGEKTQKIRLTATHKMFTPQTLSSNDIDIMGRVIAKLSWL